MKKGELVGKFKIFFGRELLDSGFLFNESNYIIEVREEFVYVFEKPIGDEE